MYVLPPNNAIATITDPNQPESLRKAIVDLDLKLQNRNKDTEPHGALVPGWGGRKTI